jgi:Flp pilus assembly protein TadD
MTGTVLGTPAYMSYEQASGMRSDELDARSDIYSLGVVVYEMLTGRTPFHSDTPVGFLRKHLMEEPPPFRAVKPGLPAPPRIESVVMKALTKDRNQRYDSVLEFAAEFTQAVVGGSEPAAQHEPVKPQPQAEFSPVPKTIVPAALPTRGPKSTVRVQRVEARHPKLPWLLGALGFVILITVAWFWTSRASKAPSNVPKNASKPVQNPVTESGAGQRVTASQSLTAKSRPPPKPASQPADTKAQLAEKHFLKGYALFSKGDVDGAIVEYREATRLKPDFADAHGLLALALEQEGDFDGAIGEYRQMVRLSPNDAQAHFGLGVNLGLKGDWDGEITEEREAIRLKADNAEAHFNLGLALGEKGDLDGAISEFRMAIRLKADYAMAHNALGLALEQKGELQPALEEYRKAYELAPKNPTVRGDYEKLVKRLNPQP